MTSLLVIFLRPYRWPLLLVVGLLLVQSLANLYLPELYADIINNGVATGDTEYILRTGAVMLAVTVVLGIVSIIAVYVGGEGLDGVRARPAAEALGQVTPRPPIIPVPLEGLLETEP